MPGISDRAVGNGAISRQTSASGDGVASWAATRDARLANAALAIPFIKVRRVIWWSMLASVLRRYFALNLRQELIEHLQIAFRLFDVGQMRAFFENSPLRAGDAVLDDLRLHRCALVVPAGCHQRRDRD